MRAHLLIAATAALSVATAAVAEPAKPVQKAAQPSNGQAEVLVASVDNVRPEAAAPAKDSGAPVKRARKARVNSCRCGDQAAPASE